jgi:hypothetical protein
MPTLTIKIEMDNAAFDPPGAEVARILKSFAGRIEGSADLEDLHHRGLSDYNGNCVGRTRVTGRKNHAKGQ